MIFLKIRKDILYNVTVCNFLTIKQLHNNYNINHQQPFNKTRSKNSFGAGFICV